jgi:hypothetical protein
MTLRSLLLSREIYHPERNAILRSIGVAAVFVSSRISTGEDRYRNFTPARCLFRAKMT